MERTEDRAHGGPCLLEVSRKGDHRCNDVCVCSSWDYKPSKDEVLATFKPFLDPCLFCNDIANGDFAHVKNLKAVWGLFRGLDQAQEQVPCSFFLADGPLQAEAPGWLLAALSQEQEGGLALLGGPCQPRPIRDIE